jgi:hypothetical protein
MQRDVFCTTSLPAEAGSIRSSVPSPIKAFLMHAIGVRRPFKLNNSYRYGMFRRGTSVTGSSVLSMYVMIPSKESIY